MKAELDSRATALYVKTDDLLKDSPHLAPWRPAVGIAPQLTDAELVTRAMMQAMPGFTSEAKWLRHAAPPRGHRKPPVTRRRRGFTLADPLGTLAILSVVAVVALWVMNQGGPLSLTTPDRAMGSLGLLTGLLASDLMILQVVLLARIPWVERSWGHDLLTRRHRWIGFASFWLMIAHVVLFAVERAVREPDETLDALIQVFITDSWMLFATVGTILLSMVVVTSIRAARRKLRYESWHLLHLYSYAGIAATFPHTFVDGADFHETWTRIYWWCLYGFAFAVTLLYRIALPGWRSLRHRLRVDSVITEAPGTVSITLKGHRLDKMKTASGQFFIWRFLDGPGWSRGNPYTLSAAPTADRLRQRGPHRRPRPRGTKTRRSV